MDDFDSDLPDELQGGRTRAQAPQNGDEERADRIEALGIAIAEKRGKAVAARKASGIESVWTSCEEAYLGIDESNRHEFAGAKWIKPTSMSGPVTTSRENGNDSKSTAFVLLTSRYVDMAAAKVCEITLPIDDKAFSFDPTPVADLILQLDDDSPLEHEGQPVMHTPEPMDGQPAPPPRQATASDLAKKKIEAARDAVEKAETRVWDWMTEAGFPAEMREVLHDAARIGTGMLKGPYPNMTTSKALSKVGGGLKLTIMSKPTVGYKWLDVWNFFPDGACGQDIHSGDHCFERDFISRSTLKRLKREVNSMGTPIYMPGQIDKVLLEGPGKCNTAEGANPMLIVNKERFEIWYFTGMVKLSDMQLTTAVGLEELPDDMDEVFAIVTIVNDTVIRATLNPLESGGFPYRALPWTKRAGSWAGRGVGEQVAMPQRMVNAGTRALLNNAGVSSGSQIVIDPIGLIPADGKPTITPLKIWHRTPDATTDDVRKLFMAVDIPNQGERLMAIIQYGMKLAEDASSIPLVSQGKTGENMPTTFGQAELQNNNANALLRGIGLRIDDYITEPVVTDSYEMLLLDPEVPDDEKGDCKIVANGTMAMVEKSIQEQAMLSAGQMTTNPAFGIDPKKWFAEYWKTKRLDPRKIQYTEDELKKMAEAEQPEAPAITAAKLRNASAEKIAAGRGEVELKKVAADTDRDTAYVNAETQRIEAVAATEQRKLETQERIANLTYQTKLMEFAQAEKVSIQEAKTKLADTAMRLGVQKELSAADRTQDLHKHRNPSQVITPPTEPYGRAPNGKSFQA